MNWADKRDNFVSDVLVLSGLSLSDNHESAYAIADRIVGQFQEVLGTNSVRMPVNEPTILTAFDMYSGALDVALEHGRVAMGYWGLAWNVPDIADAPVYRVSFFRANDGLPLNMLQFYYFDDSTFFTPVSNYYSAFVRCIKN